MRKFLTEAFSGIIGLGVAFYLGLSFLFGQHIQCGAMRARVLPDWYCEGGLYFISSLIVFVLSGLIVYRAIKWFLDGIN